VPEYSGLARGRPQEVEQDSDRGRLAGAVQPEEPKDLTARNLEVKVIYRDESPITLGQSAN
jgi:hypothetical protein